MLTARFTNAAERTIAVTLEPDYSSPFEAALLGKSYIRQCDDVDHEYSVYDGFNG